MKYVKIMATSVTSHLAIFQNNIYMEQQIPTNKINVRFKCTTIQSLSIVQPIYVSLRIYLCLFPNCNIYGAEQMVFLQQKSMKEFSSITKAWRYGSFGENVGGEKVKWFGNTAQSCRPRGSLSVMEANSMKKILTNDPWIPRSLAQRVELYDQSTLLYQLQHTIFYPLSPTFRGTPTQTFYSLNSRVNNSSLEFC